VAAPVVHLFGFKPASLLGRSLSHFVDALEPHHACLPDLVAAMLAKAAEKPGLSWRVGVHAPWEPGCSGLSATQVCGAAG
jgi:hypothetical protein